MRYPCCEINGNALEVLAKAGIALAADCPTIWRTTAAISRGAGERGRTGKSQREAPTQTCGGQCDELPSMPDRERPGGGLLRYRRPPDDGGAARRVRRLPAAAGGGHAARLRRFERT